MERIFMPPHPKAQTFIQWFGNLYEISGNKKTGFGKLLLHFSRKNIIVGFD